MLDSCAPAPTLSTTMPLVPPLPDWPTGITGTAIPAVVVAGGHAPPNTINATQPWPAVQPVAVPPPAGGLALIAKLKKIRSVAPFLSSVTGEHASPIRLKFVVKFFRGRGTPVVTNTPAGPGLGPVNE